MLPKLLRAAYVTLAVSSFTLPSCGVEPVRIDEVSDQGDEELTGGRPATSTEFQSTLFIGNCTAAKVGPRHILVAAHCVHDYSGNTVQFGFRPGDTISITNSKSLSTAQYVTVHVSQTTIHPQWINDCVTPCQVNIVNATHPPDVALIVLQEDTPTIPQAQIDLAPVAVNDPLVIMGYGCETGLNGGGFPERLKLEFVPALASTALSHEGSFVTPANVQNMYNSYVVTPGQGQTTTAASLCFGDSGGPTYRNDGQQRNVVGINAYYTFSPSAPAGVSWTNLHTRVNTASRYGIGSFLQNLGVNVRTTGTALPRTGWVASASSTSGADVPARALDGNTATRFSTGIPQSNAATQSFTVDMLSARTFNQIVIDSPGSDYARNYQVYASDSTTNWGTAIATGTSTTPVTTINFATRTARYLQVRALTAAGVGSWWSIREFNVFAPQPGLALPRTSWVVSASATSGTDVASRAIDGNATTRWSSGSPQSNATTRTFTVDMATPQTFAKVVLESATDYARSWQLFSSSDGVDWGTAFATGTGTGATTTITFAQRTARYVQIRQTTSAGVGSWWSIHELNIHGP